MAENMDMEIEPNNDSGNRNQNQIHTPSSSHNVEHMQVSVDNSTPSVSGGPLNAPTAVRDPLSKVKPVHSDHSEFDSTDDRDYFEIWSSDSTSQNSCDEDNSADKMDIDEEMAAKRKKKNDQGSQWGDIQDQRIHKFEFTDTTHIVEPHLTEEITPAQCFRFFVDDDVINMLVNETNKFARSKFIKPNYHKDFLTGWMDVTPTEMLEFIGLLVFMNFRILPATKYYWSSERDMATPFAGYIMTETRFKRLMTFWHFGDENGNDFSKIAGLLNLLNMNFAKHKTPRREMYIGKTTIHLRERYSKQTNTMGVPIWGHKVLRLVDNEAYTYKIDLIPPAKTVERNVRNKLSVLKLLRNYLDVGRIFIFDNLFLSVDIADTLLKRQSHIIGPIHRKSRSLPEKFIQLKVQENEIKGYQNPDGISIFKWKIDDMRGCGLSTCHGCDSNHIENHKEQVQNITPPTEFLKDYNNRIEVFELVEKYSISESPVNSETTWFRRLANDLITGICVSNAFHLYKKLSNDKTCQFYKFQDHLWKQLVGFTWLLQAGTPAEDG